MRTHSQAQPAARRAPPLPLGRAVLFFGVPALMFRGFIYLGMPLLIAAGLSRFVVYLACYGGFLLLLLLAALVGYRREGSPWAWDAWRERFRLKPLDGRAWDAILGGFFAAAVGYLALSFTERWIARISAFAPPATLAYLDPRVAPSIAYASFMDVPLRGNWLALLAISALLVLNILGEELWWRGYLLPRQELSAGRRAWVAHGLLWTLFHAVFYPWTAISYLPICLAIPYIAQRRQSTSPGMVIHLILNGFHLWLPVTLGVLGMHP